MNTDRAVKLQEQAWNLEAEGKLDEAAIAVRKALLLLQESDEANSPDAANLLNDLPKSRVNARASRMLRCWQNGRIPLKTN